MTQYMTEKPKVIPKESDNAKVSPNLADYQATRDSFSWEVVEKEIEFFDDGKMNA